MQIVIINPRYSFGKDKVYLNGSVCGIAAVLMAMGHLVRVVDLNLDRLADQAVRQALATADLIGISLVGAAYIPETLKLIPRLRKFAPRTPILLGGQVVEHLEPSEFARIIGVLDGVVQIRDNEDLARVLGCDKTAIPSAYAVPFRPVFEAMGEGRVLEYLRREMTLVVGQGCHFRCEFCPAHKGEKEQFRALTNFELDLHYLANLAMRHGITTLSFYASNLDFFQNPDEVKDRLEILARAREETGVNIRVRCLSCFTSFIQARKRIPDLGDLLRRAGLWCVAFGSDGVDEEHLTEQKKTHNTMARLVECLEISHELGLQTEILMVLGFSHDNWVKLGKTIITCLFAVLIWWQNVIIRPYLAKEFVPGNAGWIKDKGAVGKLLRKPGLFYNLDFAALGSQLTHPERAHRWLSNLAYLFLCSLAIIGKGSTSPLLPQGRGGWWGAIARWINRLLPSDH